MSRVIIADIRSRAHEGTVKGHGYAVASNYLQVFKAATEVKVAGGPAYDKKFGRDAVSLPYDTGSARSAWLDKWRVLLNARHLFRVCRRDTIVVQSSGVVTAMVGILLFKRPETRVFMILYNQDALKSRLKRFIFRLVKRKINGIICPNDEVGKAHGLPYCLVPDYIYCPNPAQEKPAIPYADKKYDFSMVGLIWRDKGMVEAARHLAGTPYKVLIAGEISGEEGLEDDLRAACDGAENIDLRIGYLSPEAYDDAIRNSRYCVLNYSGAYSQHSSGVVFDILFRGVPVVGKRCRTLEFVEQFGIGYTYGHMSEFEPQKVLQESVFHEYCHRLKAYYAAHLSYGEQVRGFVLPQGQGK